MSKFRALLIYEDLIRGLQRSLSNRGAGLEEALEPAFGYLMSKLHLQNLGLFWWDPAQNCLRLHYTYYAGSMMEGEEEIETDARQVRRGYRREIERWIAELRDIALANDVHHTVVRTDEPIPRILASIIS